MAFIHESNTITLTTLGILLASAVACSDTAGTDPTDQGSDGVGADAGTDGLDDANSASDAGGRGVGDGADLTDTGLPDDLTIWTLLESSLVEVNEPTTVSCFARDDDGTAWNLLMIIEAPVEVSLDGELATSTTPGSYSITCRLQAEDDAVDHEPALLQVVAGPVAQLEARLEPNRTAYPLGAEIALAWSAADAFGNPIELAPHEVTVEVTPEGAFEDLHDGTYRLIGDGTVSFRVAFGEGEAVVDDTVLAVIDSLSPIVTITAPIRDAMLTGADAVSVTGSVELNGSPTELVTANGVEVALAEDGSFSASLTPSQGLNVVLVEATDAAGNLGAASRSWLQAGAWAPVGETPTPEGATTGPLAHLGPDAIDDATVDESTIDDLAQGLLGATASVDDATVDDLGAFDSEISHTQTAGTCSPLFEFHSPSVSFKPGLREVSVAPTAPMPTLVAREGGLDFSWTGPVTARVQLDTSSEFRYRAALVSCAFGSCGCTFPIASEFGGWRAGNGSVNVDVIATVTVSGSIDWDGEASPTVVASAIAPTDLAFGPGTGDVSVYRGTVTWGQDNTPTQAGPLTTAFHSRLADMLGVETWLKEGLQDAGLLERIGEDTELAFESRGLVLDAVLQGFLPAGSSPIGMSTGEVSWASTLAELAVTEDAIDLAVGTSVGVVPVVPEASRGPGAVTRGDCFSSSATTVALDGDDVGFAIPLDTLNELLYAAWIGSPRPLSLNPTAIDLDEELPPGFFVVDIALTAGLPPVLTDCTPEGALQAQLGGVDVEVTYEYLEETFTASTDLSISAPLTLWSDSHYRVDLGAETIHWLRTVTSEDAPEGNLSAMTDAIALRLAREVLLESPVTDAIAAFGPLALSLQPFGNSALDLHLIGPVTAEAGFLLHDQCAAAECETGATECSAEGDIQACWQSSGTCVAHVLETSCLDQGLTCDETGGSPVCQ